MKKIICYGDSNTFGYNPKDGSRFDENIRWTSLLQKNLGVEYEVINEGMCDRTGTFQSLNFCYTFNINICVIHRTHRLTRLIRYWNTISELCIVLCLRIYFFSILPLRKNYRPFIKVLKGKFHAE